MTHHPTILVYGDTLKYIFPLILIIGREPNNVLPVRDTVEEYDFDTARHCAFWNFSHGFVARIVNKRHTARDFKQLCRSKKASPIAYADSLPICIPNETVGKQIARSSVSDADINRHIDNIFRHRQIINRTALVLLSGLRDPVFERSVRRIREMSHHCLDVPFFGSTEHKMKNMISDLPCDAQLLLKKLYLQFKKWRPRAVSSQRGLFRLKA